MRNHLGQYECRLCLTLHTNEGNYLAHTQVRWVGGLGRSGSPSVTGTGSPRLHSRCGWP